MINITKTNVTKGSALVLNNQEDDLNIASPRKEAVQLGPQSKSSFGKMRFRLERTASGITEGTSSIAAEREQRMKYQHFYDTNNQINELIRDLSK